MVKGKFVCKSCGKINEDIEVQSERNSVAIEDDIREAGVALLSGIYRYWECDFCGYKNYLGSLNPNNEDTKLRAKWNRMKGYYG